MLLRTRAVLAGGLVLGIGATLTLAAWNDSEHVTGGFQASVFVIESNVGSGWASHDQAPGATMAFNAADMSPSVSRYAHMDIRTTVDTTVAGVVKLETATDAGVLAQVLQYRIVSTGPGVLCDATGFSGSSAWVAGGPTTYIAGGLLPPSTPDRALGAEGATTTRYCFDVRVRADAANSYQGTSGTLSWGFVATSNV